MHVHLGDFSFQNFIGFKLTWIDRYLKKLCVKNLQSGSALRYLNWWIRICIEVPKLIDPDPHSGTVPKLMDPDLHCTRYRTEPKHCYQPVFRIRIHGIHMFLCLPDPDLDPLVKGMDPDPDLSIILLPSSKNSKKTLIPTVLWLLLDFLSSKNDINVPPKGKKEQDPD